jgi:hypothetical protein
MDEQQRTAIMELPDLPAARPADVASPEAIVAAVYDVISGPAEVERARDWDRLRALFLPGARFLLTRWHSPEGGDRVLRAWDVEAFVAAASGFYRESAFYEREVARRVDRFGCIAHVMSTYESRVGSEGSDPVARGINSVQVVYSRERWWIAHLVWDVETPTNPIPREYLPALPGGSGIVA